jgi:hypothetical protein
MGVKFKDASLLYKKNCSLDKELFFRYPTPSGGSLPDIFIRRSPGNCQGPVRVCFVDLRGKEPMTFLAILLGAGAVAALIGSISHTKSTAKALGHLSASRQLPQAVNTLFAIAELTELTRVVEHVTMVHIVATLLVFAIWQAAKSGTENTI